MFADISSLPRTFICVDALDEFVPKHRVEVLDELGQIVLMSPNTRIFITGRPYIRGVVERRLRGRAIILLIKPRDPNVATYLRTRLKKDTTPDVNDSGLEADIMKSVAEEISES